MIMITRFKVLHCNLVNNDETLHATVKAYDNLLPREFKKVTKIDFELTDTIIPAPSRGYVYINLHEGFYLFDDNHILHVSEWRQFK